MALRYDRSESFLEPSNSTRNTSRSKTSLRLIEADKLCFVSGSTIRALRPLMEWRVIIPSTYRLAAAMMSYTSVAMAAASASRVEEWSDDFISSQMRGEGTDEPAALLYMARELCLERDHGEELSTTAVALLLAVTADRAEGTMV